MATEGIHKETEAGNLKAPPRRRIIKWILDPWSALLSEMIKNFFMHCSLNLPVDGSLDNRIHCFKEKQPWPKGRELLRSQFSIIDENHLDSFQVTESDVEEAYELCQLIDPEEEGDEDIHIL